MKTGRVKNPCKICFETVNKKKGMQCKGACKKWAHFKCLDFTPGQIKDVKDGNVTITCPCPDCNASDLQNCCLAKKPDSPLNRTFVKPIPFLPQSMPYSHEAPRETHTSCGTIFDEFSFTSLTRRTTTGSTSPQLYMACPPTKMFRSTKTSPNLTPETSHCAPCCPNKKTLSTSALASSSSSSSSSASGIHIKCIPQRVSSSDSKLPSDSSKKEFFTSLEEMCKTVAKLSCQLRKLMFKMLESKQME